LKSGLYGFLFGMWILILVGGGIVVTILGPISISGFGELNWFIGSVVIGSPATIRYTREEYDKKQREWKES